MVLYIPSQMARGTQREELTVMVPVLDMGYGEGPLVGVERLTRSPALLPARLALPACLFLDGRGACPPVGRVC